MVLVSMFYKTRGVKQLILKLWKMWLRDNYRENIIISIIYRSRIQRIIKTFIVYPKLYVSMLTFITMKKYKNKFISWQSMHICNNNQIDVDESSESD